jgi:hypothetical protein
MAGVAFAAALALAGWAWVENAEAWLMINLVAITIVLGLVLAWRHALASKHTANPGGKTASGIAGDGEPLRSTFMLRLARRLRTSRAVTALVRVMSCYVGS